MDYVVPRLLHRHLLAPWNWIGKAWRHHFDETGVARLGIGTSWRRVSMKRHHKKDPKRQEVDLMKFLPEGVMLSIDDFAKDTKLERGTARNRLLEFETKGQIVRKYAVVGMSRKLCFMRAVAPKIEHPPLDEPLFCCFFNMVK